MIEDSKISLFVGEFLFLFFYLLSFEKGGFFFFFFWFFLWGFDLYGKEETNPEDISISSPSVRQMGFVPAFDLFSKESTNPEIFR